MSVFSDNQRAYLSYPHYCVLATIGKDGAPQLSTVWYELEGEQILVCLEADSLKLKNLRRDPRCAASIPNGGRYVAVRGTVEIEEGHELGWQNLVRLGSRYYGPFEGLKQAEFLAGGDKKHVTVRINVEKVTSVGVS